MLEVKELWISLGQAELRYNPREENILCVAPVAKMLDAPPMPEVRHFPGLPANATR